MKERKILKTRKVKDMSNRDFNKFIDLLVRLCKIFYEEDYKDLSDMCEDLFDKVFKEGSKIISHYNKTHELVPRFGTLEEVDEVKDILKKLVDKYGITTE